MAAPRGEFTSRFGFLMAASGSAVGLGNIWGFPTNAASNGGAAFLFTYLILAFALAYPALMAELIIGRYARANAVTALRTISSWQQDAAPCPAGRIHWYCHRQFYPQFLWHRQRLDDCVFPILLPACWARRNCQLG